ncbi:MAG TPA: pyridoxal-dependent decarboxylase [Gemmatimonadaceae bacterium]|nr:pyridoxal-dependent decarboxylase [Gemmatimonadaceae bacterium]
MTSPPSRHHALAAWFLGPRGENAELLERLVTEALRDHVFWRRNYHPEDGFTIRETEKRSEEYEDAVATLTQELMGLLAELKRGVPFFSGRYKGHMSFEQTIASQIGYFAAMLYNPNNVSIEASPVTTRLELELAAQLAAMIGYDEAASWGHLTSGGTVANFEALWIARNVIYLPLAAAGAADELRVSIEVERLDGTLAPLGELSLWELVNVRDRAVMDLWERLWSVAPRAEVYRALSEHSLSTVGYQDYARRLASAYGDTLPASVVLVAATAHYSWEKIVRALGIGSNQLVFVPVDGHYRMDPDALWRTVRELTERRTPIMACVSVCGSTEESAIDRLDEVLAVRERAERELGVTFHIHSDACYGGYVAAVTRRSDGSRRSAAEIRASMGLESGEKWPDEGWVRALAALERADSVTIDPHKLGYVPYPAGALLLRDRRARELVAVDPPYLLPTQGLDSAQDLFLGRFIFEGSKPGAAAAAVWLSHKVLPLDERGYGYLIERTMVGARRMHAALEAADLGEMRIVLLPAPDVNIVCYVMHHPSLSTLAAVNAFNESIYARMSLGVPGATPPYIITRTRLQAPMYRGAVEPLLERLGVCDVAEWEASGADGLVVLRSTVMDPFLVAPPPAPDHITGFVSALRTAALASLDKGLSH